MSKIQSVSSQSIARAVEILAEGGLVAIPTETVYGLAADARDGRAVARIFAAKGRPSFNPLIVHVPDLEAAQKYGVFSQRDLKIVSSFWPGPVTLIAQRRADCGISELVSAGLPTLAIRVPAHKTARALLKACGFPLAAPSANASGGLSPTSPMHVAQSIGDYVDMILADGACAVGLESTVVDCTGDKPLVLRPGAVSAEDISAVLGEEVAYDLGGGKDNKAPKSPGQILKHYAPSIALRMNAVDVRAGEALLAFGSLRFMGVEGLGAAVDLPEDSLRNLSKEGDLYEAAANLFAMLHALDTPAHTGIAVMPIPEQGIGIAINDRLRRAAASS